MIKGEVLGALDVNGSLTSSTLCPRSRIAPTHRPKWRTIGRYIIHQLISADSPHIARFTSYTQSTAGLKITANFNLKFLIGCYAWHCLQHIETREVICWFWYFSCCFRSCHSSKNLFAGPGQVSGICQSFPTEFSCLPSLHISTKTLQVSFSVDFPDLVPQSQQTF